MSTSGETADLAMKRDYRFIDTSQSEIDFIRIKVYNNYNKIWQTGP